MARPWFAVMLSSLVVAGCGHSQDASDDDGGPVATDDGGEAGDDASSGADAATDGGPVPLVTEPDQGMQPIYDFIGTATKTIDMTMYEDTDTEVTSLLTKAAANGVAVRVILDQNLEKSSNTTAYTALGAANVGVHWANPTYAATHQKTITVDGTVSAVMSLNLATEDYKTSRDFAVFTTDAADVAAIEAVFASDFIDAPVTPGNGDDLVWSPTNSQSSLVGIIGGAKASLLVENEEMGDSSIVSALAGAASRGVDVQVVMENSSSYQSEFTTLVNAGVKLVTYAHSALYIHAKVILADYGASGARVFIGSENFSNASLTENRELGLVTTDAGIMASIHGTLTSDFAGGTTFKPSASSADAGP